MVMSAEQLLQTLEASDQGDELALENLIGVVYNELRALAAVHLRQERPDHTLQPTALVHEVYLKLFEQSSVAYHNRLHFFRVAARQIRRVLVDHARRRNRGKRYGNLCRVTLDRAVEAEWPVVDMLALDGALRKLEEHSADALQIVELKYFSGLTEAEIAELLDVSDRTVRRRWIYARAWLLRELGNGSGADND